MPEYAKGYADRTAWMHQSGVDMVRAAVLRQAIEDYVESCKIVIALSGEITGRNVDKLRNSRINKLTYQHKNMGLALPLEEYIMRGLWSASNSAQRMVDEVERFFQGQAFLLFCDNATGTAVQNAAREWVRAWANDENRGRLKMSILPAENADRVQRIKRASKRVHANTQKAGKGPN